MNWISLSLSRIGVTIIKTNSDAAKKLSKPYNYNNKYFVRSVKDHADGALGSRGALFLEDYSDYPGYRGEPRKSEDELARSATELLKIGFNMRVHCIGDAANRTAINAFERALKATGTDAKKARFSLEHCQVLTAEDVRRLAKLGIVASMQPLHATEDMHFAESRIGSERLKYAYIWRDLLHLGVAVAGVRLSTQGPCRRINNPFSRLPCGTPPDVLLAHLGLLSLLPYQAARRVGRMAAGDTSSRCPSPSGHFHHP